MYELRILRIQEAGLVDAWQKRNQGRVGCVGVGKEKRVTFSPLTLENLVGPWIVLLIGPILLLLYPFAIFLKIKLISLFVDEEDSLQ